jgi:hypothetical protein
MPDADVLVMLNDDTLWMGQLPRVPAVNDFFLYQSESFRVYRRALKPPNGWILNVCRIYVPETPEQENR